MDVDEVWRHIDRERSELADLLESFTQDDWEVPSLCAGWRVREVAAHLTLAHMGVGPAVVSLVRARGSFDQMIRDTALRRSATLPPAAYADRVRAMVGSRRTAPGVSPVEPLVDALVHTQDMLVPLGHDRSMDPAASAIAVQRAWSMGFPFHARKRLAGFRLVATDHPWAAGEGATVEAPAGDLLLLVTGRYAVLPRLGGPGAAPLASRLADA